MPSRNIGMNSQTMKDVKYLQEVGFNISRLMLNFYEQLTESIKDRGIEKTVADLHRELPIDYDTDKAGQICVYRPKSTPDYFSYIAAHGLDIHSISRRFIRSTAKQIQDARKTADEN